MPIPIMQQTYNMLYIGPVLPQKTIQVPSQYSSHMIQTGIKTSTHMLVINNTPFVHACGYLQYLNNALPGLSTLQIFCIHHQNNYIGTYEQLNQLTRIVNNLSIPQPYT